MLMLLHDLLSTFNTQQTVWLCYVITCKK